jgi:hypothetical protein
MTMQEILHIMAWVFGILAGGVWALIGLVLAGAGWVALREWLSSARWEQSPARIVTSEVKRVQRREDQPLFQPVVGYSLVTDGQEVSGGQAFFIGNLYSSEARARKIVDRYLAGQMVMVLCNPRYPEETVLERRGGPGGFLLLVLGIILMVIPLAAASLAGLPAWPFGGLLLAMAATAFCLDRANRKRLLRARRSGLYPAPGKGSEEDVRRLLRQGEKALAIHLYRKLNRTDLGTARKMVDEMASPSEPGDSGGGEERC